MLTNGQIGILFLVLITYFMSKKNRYKFRDRPAANTNNSANVTNVNAPSPVSNTTARVVSEKGVSPAAAAQHVAEYKIISKDLIRLVVLNGVMLAAVLVVYFTNRSSGYLERIFQHLFKM